LDIKSVGIQPRPVEQVSVSIDLDPYLTIKALAGYSAIGARTLRAYLSDPNHPIPHYRVGGKILVRRSEFDAWMRQFRRIGNEDVNAVVSDVLKGLR
jgi:excisionase family DNA binding protein